MKAHVYVGRDVEINDHVLPIIVRAVKRERRARKQHTDFEEYPVQAYEIIEKAVELGYLELDGDLSTDGDDDRVWWRGRLISGEEHFKVLKSRKAKKG